MMLINKGVVKTPYKMESITTTANVEKSLTIVAKVSILDVFGGSWLRLWWRHMNVLCSFDLACVFEGLPGTSQFLFKQWFHLYTGFVKARNCCFEKPAFTYAEKQ